MTAVSPNVIAVGYAKRALVKGTREYERMLSYSSVFGQYHLIVFTKASEGYPSYQQEGKLFLYATNTKSQLGKLFRAYYLGWKILKSQKQAPFIVSGQDPLLAGLVAIFLSCTNNAFLHIQLHGDIFNKYFFGHSKLAKLKRFFSLLVLNKARKIRVVSERIEQSLLERGIEESKVKVLPVESDIETFLQVGERRMYKKNEPLTFLYVGRFSPEKDISMLLRAFALARAQGLEAHLELLGEGPLKKMLSKQVVDLQLEDMVTFLPWSNEVSSVMAQADILCLSSKHEGFAMVIVEAMAAGLPVLTTDVGCAGERMKNGEHGWIVSVGDVNGYAEALLDISSDSALRERYGRQGFRAAKEQQFAQSYLHEIKDSFTL